MIHRFLGTAILVGTLVWSTPTHAQLHFGADKPRVFSIQPRPFRLGHEFQIGLGLIPLDAFYVGTVLAGSYTYHFSDFWAWEIVHVGYSHNIDTSLEVHLDSEYGLQPEEQGIERLKVHGLTSLVMKPMFGKIGLLNRAVIYSETFFALGAGPFLKEDYWRFALSAGGGMRFWSSQLVSFRLDVRDFLIISPDRTVENSLFIMLSAAFNHHAGHKRPDRDERGTR